MGFFHRLFKKLRPSFCFGSKISTASVNFVSTQVEVINPNFSRAMEHNPSRFPPHSNHEAEATNSELSITSGDQFEFAFNSRNFSDRILRIEIIARPSDNISNNIEIGNVKSLYINSAILAVKSQFFYKLFSNGMRESDQRHATIRINASEEDALIELLSFMYSEKLSTTSPPLLLDVLMVADKFEVASCMRHCTQLLKSLEMTTESALLYLELPSSVSMALAVQPLTDAAKEFLINKYQDISKFQAEMMNLSLAGIESILSSSKLEVASEDTLYEFVLKWARAQYPKVEERREILTSRLIRFLKFPFMTHKKLLKALTCKDLDHEVAKKAVLDALLFKSETAHRQQIMASEESLKEHFIERAYKYKPVEVMEFLHPFSQCIVHLNLKRSECSDLFPNDHVHSQPFYLGGQGFFLSARCNMDQNKSFHCFGLFLGMQEMGSTSFTVDYEFAARMLPSGDFVRKYEGYFTFMGERAVGYRNLFAVPWTRFTADDSPYFIDDTLYLKAELTIKHQSQPQQQPH